jgi:hypothetical protein
VETTVGRGKSGNMQSGCTGTYFQGVCGGRSDYSCHVLARVHGI